MKVGVLAVVASVVGCGASFGLSPQDIDASSRECRRRIADGTYDMRTMPGVHSAAKPAPAGTPVILYGASWCTACKVAQQYMTRRGIPFVDRDVEEEEGAEAARLATLASAGLAKTKGLPVIDVRGTVMVGFLSCALEQAWGAP